MDPENPLPASPVERQPRPTQVILGVFIVWQLLFLAASNLLLFRSHTQPQDRPDQPALQRAADAVERFALNGLSRYGQLTGQVQGWWMFALTLPDSTFPLVELRWNDEVKHPPRQVRSLFDPEDPGSYFHLPGARDRLFHYEMNLGLYNPWEKKRLNREDAEKKARPTYAYLRWRLQQFQDEHPDVPPPDAVILYRRAYPLPPYGSPLQRSSAVDRPLFRWRPDQPEVEPFDPAAHRFVPLKDTP